ncbi:MAG: hypothetical protein LKE40_08085 [Spirochaetia bacterium]|jgi:sedoheptulokinase|nr:hypothetical protein [Spirochaetia bacterium]
MKLIGLDIGTTSICGISVDVETKKICRTLSCDNAYIEGSDLQDALQDPEAIYVKTKRILDALIDEGDDEIVGCSISSQMHGIVYVDAHGNAVSPFYTWQNQWGRKKHADGISTEELLSEKLGFPVYTGYGIVTDACIPRPATATSFCNIGDYVLLRLIGTTRPVCDVSIAASLGIWDVEKEELVYDDVLFPSVTEEPKIQGIYRDVPMVQPLGDNQASFLGSVKGLEHTLLLHYGTSGQLSFYQSGKASFSGFEKRPLGTDGFLHVAFSLCGGDSYRILARFFCKVLESFGYTCDIARIIKHMDGFDFSVSGHPMVCQPMFLGERGKPGAYASFTDIDVDNFTPESMTLALTEGMVEELFRFYRMLPEAVKKEKTLLLGAGNGLKKNLLLRQKAEQAYGKKILFHEEIEDSAMGAVIHAGVGIGMFHSYGEALEKFYD